MCWQLSIPGFLIIIKTTVELSSYHAEPSGAHTLKALSVLPALAQPRGCGHHHLADWIIIAPRQRTSVDSRGWTHPRSVIPWTRRMAASASPTGGPLHYALPPSLPLSLSLQRIHSTHTPQACSIILRVTPTNDAAPLLGPQPEFCDGEGPD